MRLRRGQRSGTMTASGKTENEVINAEKM